MLKMIASVSPCLRFLRTRATFSTVPPEKDSFVPSVIDGSQKFFRNVYGIEMQKHTLPFNTTRYLWRSQQMKDYRRKIPNYVVILVNKVLDNAEEHSNVHSPDKEKQLIDKFYPIATYCKVRYQQKYTQFQGLFRVKINKIQALQSQSSKNNDNIEIIQTQQPDQQKLQDEQQIAASQPEPVTKELSIKRAPRKVNLTLYSLQVDKREEYNVKLNHNIQLRLKFLIETYKLFFPSINQYRFVLFNLNQSLKNIYMIAQQMSNQNFKVKQIQAILQTNEHQQKMSLIQQLLNKTLDWKNIYKNMQRMAESNLKNKKFFQYYSEIFKIAKQSIDGKKGKQLFMEKVTKQFYEKRPPKAIKQVFEVEKQKYASMEESAVQASVIKKYLQDLSKIPYSIKSDEFYDLQFAQKALEIEHYGMKEVKDAILQIIAVGKLKGTLKGKIFCLIGGPGLGKTTIAKSIAKALGRKFYSISLGGVTDSSVLKGHRRTYVGAYAGKIIQALKICESNNPVILLDQIDKMGSSHQGDPRSELLEILDPNQNETFVDNYIDVPIDLSNVLFVCSANYEQNISKPLLDRMEKIKLNSYTDDEKKQIFKLHLLRRAIQKTGVLESQFILKPDVLESLIYEYSLGQPGVRRLQKNIQKILERVAYQIVQGTQSLPITISKQNLKDYLGNSYFNRRNHNNLSIGMALSLGGGDYGSRLTHIQSFRKSFVGKKQHKRGVMFTGSLGDVFKQAMNISYTYARNFLEKNLKNTFLYENQVHIHAPDGASKKDGSMDSLTICSSLVSLAIQRSVKEGYAMTGQITLHGKILRTHGIKQKILMARRQKIWNLVIPAQNKPDVDMLGDNIKDGFNFHFVKQFSQVYSLLFQEGFSNILNGSLQGLQIPQTKVAEINLS